MELSDWAIKSIEEQIAARGEATHYEPLRREEIAGRAPAAARLMWFNACAQDEGYRITRSDTTGGIVIQRVPELEISTTRAGPEGTTVLIFADAGEVTTRTDEKGRVIEAEWTDDASGAIVELPRKRAAQAFVEAQRRSSLKHSSGARC